MALGLIPSREREGYAGKVAHPVPGNAMALQTGCIMGLTSDKHLSCWHLGLCNLPPLAHSQFPYQWQTLINTMACASKS